jgi:tRNA threonylcarbamoyladenosine biosynthesis protein TsaB
MAPGSAADRSRDPDGAGVGAGVDPAVDGRPDPAGRVILALDTATSLACVALGTPDGRLVAEDAWTAGYRHGEELLPRTDALLRATGLALTDLGGIVVGTGPGAFTGMRVGIATAKGLAWGLHIPIAGIPTGEALLSAAGATVGPVGRPLALLLPAGASDRVLVERDRAGHPGRPTRLTADMVLSLDPEALSIAVDLPGRASEEAEALGAQAQRRLGETLLRLGAHRLSAGDADDPASLVPEYVTLPRGVAREAAGVTLSRA